MVNLIQANSRSTTENTENTENTEISGDMLVVIAI